ncbi:hypothetical protein WR25_09454 [Diploscapter pachys]|uniref:Uncharacterized protein n=1 Tax=Diploscapter pachys TaxID=2018661 RepID=A0A2A2LGV6_9BILA|nr:hypothetical protein WR25_09454 [Diploscapter pachys]
MSIFADDVDSTAGLATIRSANAEFITKLKDKVGEVQKSLNKMQLPDLPDLTSGERAPRGDRIYKTLLDTVTADVAVYKEMAYQSHVIDLETETGNIPSVSSQSTQQSSSHSLALSRQSTQASDSHRLARMNELASQMAASQQQQSSRRAPLKEQNRPRKRAAARNQDEAMFDDDDDDF